MSLTLPLIMMMHSSNNNTSEASAIFYGFSIIVMAITYFLFNVFIFFKAFIFPAVKRLYFHIIENIENKKIKKALRKSLREHPTTSDYRRIFK